MSSSEKDRVRLLQYENLRKHFEKLVYEVLGEDYYNMGTDVYTCDKLTCEDLAHKLKQRKGLFSRPWLRK